MLVKARTAFYRWLKQAEYGDDSVPLKKSNIRGSNVMSLPRSISDITLDTSGIYFKVIPGSGGIAIEVTQYDTKSERDITTLHIIPEGEELSEELAKIITLESMKRR